MPYFWALKILLLEQICILLLKKLKNTKKYIKILKCGLNFGIYSTKLLKLYKAKLIPNSD